MLRHEVAEVAAPHAQRMGLHRGRWPHMSRDVADGQANAAVAGGVGARGVHQVGVMQRHLARTQWQGAAGLGIKALADALAASDHVHGFGFVVVREAAPAVAAGQGPHAAGGLGCV